MLAIKERPILFSGKMVRAMLSGIKTMTRRPMRIQPVGGIRLSPFVRSGYEDKHGRELRHPFGPTGTILYVRETCRAEELPNGVDGIRYKADNAFIEIENTKEAGEQWTKMYNYRHGQGLWIPSIHMPKAATRLWLVNEGTGAERLQSISVADVLAEGIVPALTLDSIGTFAILWDNIYKKGEFSWESNCWVWVMKFQKIVL